MRFVLSVFLITSTLVALARTSKILVLCPIGSHSHYTLAFKLAKELADREHEVTFINAYPQNKPLKNLNEISVAEILVAQNERKKQLLDVAKMSFIQTLTFASQYGLNYTEQALKVKAVQELLKSNIKFDVVIYMHFLNEALLIFPHLFNCPLVVLEPLPTTILSNHLFANPSPSSYVPSLLWNFASHLSFWERLRNIYYEVVGEFFVHFVMLPGQETILKRTVPEAPPLQNIMYNSSLMLLASHTSINAPVPLQPAVKEIGGFHVEPPKPLTADLQTFLDNAREGVVLFSMGTNLKSADLYKDRKNAILKVFSKFKQTVLWKFETDLPEKPKNVKINKWLPQQDILAHPNILVFISHGGLLSTIEAVHRGVPLLCIPVYWDQRRNCEDVERTGIGLMVPFNELTEENFGLALHELINNSKYRENSKVRSNLMQDQPVKQMDEAVFWIEYVIRYKGAPHLRSPGLDLTWYQMYHVDVVLFLAFISLTYLVVVFYLFRCIFGKKRKIKK